MPKNAPDLSRAATALDTEDLIHVDSLVADAVARMRDMKHDLLFTVDGDELVGTVSAFDIVVKAIGEERDPAETPVRDVMSKEVPFCRIGCSVRDAARKMAEAGVHTLAVLDEQDELRGTIHARELVETGGGEIAADVLVGLGREEAAAGDNAHRRSDPTGGRARANKSGGAGVYALRPRLRKARD